jgi:secondary thiamine-phosphate synthase enzyme
MQQIFHKIIIKTKGSGLYNFTEQTLNWLKDQKINNGILNINILHTSASLVIQENADPDVLHDLKNFFDKLVPMDNKLYKHTSRVKMTCRHTLSQHLPIISLH